MGGRILYNIFWFVIMVLAGWATWFAVMNFQQTEPTDRIKKPPVEEIGSISARVTRVEEVTSDGKIRWVLESVDLNGDIKGSFHMTKPRAIITLKDGVEIVLTAPDGDYDTNSSSMTLTGGVQAVKEDDSSKFWADEVNFSGEEKILKSSGGKIKLARGNWEFNAGGINVDLSGDEPVINLAEPVQIVGYK
jgi:LPS export ABC transporter protein LptC